MAPHPVSLGNLLSKLHSYYGKDASKYHVYVLVIYTCIVTLYLYCSSFHLSFYEDFWKAQSQKHLHLIIPFQLYPHS
jgi:hypothetical protein